VTIGPASTENVFGDAKVFIGVDSLKLVRLVLLQKIHDAFDGSKIIPDG